ncbi:MULTISPECIES: helix-turn-helix domain-containing protein [unclassified Stenotrophomonas]|uniref:GlxA family transcriptional regulator n=1 Tax=unclassified Stenotrophomonas TaxID=196198 RepID=UPI00177DE763|nr:MULTISPECIES: helix-turn-helix domain-containing protein [unclassified Stenotrophomonas]MBD8634662.1 helix-turn-helix domain-containing protein [Stenotrophomonas sp. CFBP 13725]MBD8697774.1 helix-turn-helix domain-containing protein [Stenotrophomonas sp. CFBP 13718]
MDAHKNELTEIAVVEYPGADPSAASMLAEMAHVGNRLAQQQGRHTARILVSRWVMANDGGGPQRVAGADVLDATVPAIIALPGQVSQNGQIRDEAILLEWLSAHYDGGSLLAAVNDGIGVLSRAGLLAGRAVASLDSTRFPGLNAQSGSWVPSERLLVDDGDLLTVSGSQAWRFLALRLLYRVHGQGVMAAVAQQQGIVVPAAIQQDLERFSANFAHGDRDVLKAQRWLHTTAARGATLGAICQASGLEPRTLQRRFLKATGLRPIEYCQRLRIAKAQLLLQQGGAIDEVAWGVGYADQSAFRRLFLRIVGMTPATYRRMVSGKLRDRSLAPAPVPSVMGAPVRPVDRHAA